MKTKEDKRGGIYLKFRKEVFVKFPDKVEFVNHIWLWYVCTSSPFLEFEGPRKFSKIREFHIIFHYIKHLRYLLVKRHSAKRNGFSRLIRCYPWWKGMSLDMIVDKADKWEKWKERWEETGAPLLIFYFTGNSLSSRVRNCHWPAWPLLWKASPSISAHKFLLYLYIIQKVLILI